MRRLTRALSRCQPRRAWRTEVCCRGNALYVYVQNRGERIAEGAENLNLRLGMVVELVRRSKESIRLGHGNASECQPAATV